MFAESLYFFDLSKRLIDCAGTGVTTYGLEPGFVETELARDVHSSCFMQVFTCYWNCCQGGKLSAEDGARTTIYCCIEPSIEHQTGLYYR